MRFTHRLILALALALSVSCAAKDKHIAVVVDVALFEAISDIHATEQTALCGFPSCANRPDAPIDGWSKAKSLAFNKALLPASEAGMQLNTALADWNPDDPPPSQIRVLAQALSDALVSIADSFPPGSSRERLLLQIAQAQKVALQLLSAVLGSR